MCVLAITAKVSINMLFHMLRHVGYRTCHFAAVIFLPNNVYWYFMHTIEMKLLRIIVISCFLIWISNTSQI